MIKVSVNAVGPDVHEPGQQDIESRDGQDQGTGSSAPTPPPPSTSGTPVHAAVTLEPLPQPVPLPQRWAHGLFGCFDNTSLCIITFLAPCVTYGEVARVMGKNCLLHGCLFTVPLLNCILWIAQRGMMRRRRGISGSSIGDCCTISWCGLCALTQEGMEADLIQTERAIATGKAVVFTTDSTVVEHYTSGSVTTQPRAEVSGTYVQPTHGQAYTPPDSHPFSVYPPLEGEHSKAPYLPPDEAQKQAVPYSQPVENNQVTL